MVTRQPLYLFRVLHKVKHDQYVCCEKSLVFCLSKDCFSIDGRDRRASSLQLQSGQSALYHSSSSLNNKLLNEGLWPRLQRAEFASYQQERRLHLFRLLSGTAENKDKKTSKPTEGPDAEDCDDAVGDYQALKQRLDAIKKPSTLRPWTEVVVDTGRTVLSATVTVVKFTLSVPGRVKDFYAMPKDEWAAWKTGAWKTVKHEAHHYWVGTKLLWLDMKISSRLAIKAMRGLELTRRERRQLTRTAADMFRLVPMIVILVIPFMEFALPFLLKIFPNMLPSTYEDKLKKEEEMKRRLNIKLELARFLQETVAEIAKDMSNRKGSGHAKELYEFMKKVRNGEEVDNADILRFAQLFSDELNLDNWERMHLVSICQFVGLPPFGTDAFLRTRLRAHLKQIKQDDFQIEKEGLENLLEEELRSACRARGIRASFGTGAIPIMQRRLQDWLDLSLHRGLPSSLLLLSRAFTITADLQDVAQKKDLAYEKLKETLVSMPEVAVDRVGFEALGGEAEGVEALQKKLDLLKREEALIKEELARAAVAHWQQGAASSSHGKPSSKSTAGNVASSAVGSETSEEEVAAAAAEEQQRRLRKAVQALLDLATGSGVAKERVTFMELLKNETDRLNEDLFKKPTGTLVFSNKGMEVSKTPEGEEEEPLRGAGGTSVSGGAETEEDESMPKRLSDRVSRMLIDIEKELDKVELSIGSRMHVLDTNRDGIISQEELEQAFLLIKAQLTPEEHLQLYKQLRALSADNSGDIHMTNLLQLAASAKESAQSDAGVESVHIHIK